MSQVVYERYADMLYRLAYTHLGSAHDAEDAVSDVFVKYLQTTPTFRNEEHVKAWFLRVLINRCNDLHRHRALRVCTPLDEVAEIAAADTKDKHLLETVMALPENIKSAIVLHYLEGFSLNEIAKILQTTEAAVKMRLKRGRAMLKDNLKGDMGI